MSNERDVRDADGWNAIIGSKREYLLHSVGVTRMGFGFGVFAD